MLPDEKEDRRPKPTPNPNDSLYNTGADFGAPIHARSTDAYFTDHMRTLLIACVLAHAELDAVTITAVLGVAIAFQFFVLANL